MAIPEELTAGRFHRSPSASVVAFTERDGTGTSVLPSRRSSSAKWETSQHSDLSYKTALGSPVSKGSCGCQCGPPYNASSGVKQQSVAGKPVAEVEHHTQEDDSPTAIHKRKIYVQPADRHPVVPVGQDTCPRCAAGENHRARPVPPAAG